MILIPPCYLASCDIDMWGRIIRIKDMTDTPKTASERYEEWVSNDNNIPEWFKNDEGDGMFIANIFNAGRKDFIDNDLPKLLAMAREGKLKLSMNDLFSENGRAGYEHTQTIEELLEQARKL